MTSKSLKAAPLLTDFTKTPPKNRRKYQFAYAFYHQNPYAAAEGITNSAVLKALQPTLQKQKWKTFTDQQIDIKTLNSYKYFP